MESSGQPSAINEPRSNNTLRIFATPTSARLILLSLVVAEYCKLTPERIQYRRQIEVDHHPLWYGE